MTTNIVTLYTGEAIPNNINLQELALPIVDTLPVINNNIVMDSSFWDPSSVAGASVISGITKDENGNPLSECIIDLYETSHDMKVMTTVSDSNGVYSFTGLSTAFSFYIIAYKQGSPDLAGTTINTLVAM